MYEEFVFDKLWIVLPMWLVLYVSDYLLTILGARYYKAGACDHFVFEGSYELTPEFQPDVDALRLFSRKFLRAVIISTAIFSSLWYISHQDKVCMFIFKFVCGGMILSEVPIHIRHARNIALFRLARSHQGISGQVTYKRWVLYRLSCIELAGFVFLFLIVFLLTGSVPFLGGSFCAAATALKHVRLCRREALR
jgi:hypothetical protein